MPLATSFEAIERGDYPSWRLEMQIMTPKQAEKYRFDPFDITKVWFHADFPPITIGRMVLNRNPRTTSRRWNRLLSPPPTSSPALRLRPDKLLQGRLFSYHDTHLHRLGPNYHLLPINRPKERR